MSRADKRFLYGLLLALFSGPIVFSVSFLGGEPLTFWQTAGISFLISLGFALGFASGFERQNPGTIPPSEHPHPH